MASKAPPRLTEADITITLSRFPTIARLALKIAAQRKESISRERLALQFRKYPLDQMRAAENKVQAFNEEQRIALLQALGF